jgi:hypothetical protein
MPPTPSGAPEPSGASQSPAGQTSSSSTRSHQVGPTGAASWDHQDGHARYNPRTSSGLPAKGIGEEDRAEKGAREFAG